MDAQQFRRALARSDTKDRIRAFRTYKAVTDRDIPYIETAIQRHNPKLHMSALDAIESLPFIIIKELLSTLAVFGASPGVRARAVKIAARTQYDDATHIMLQAAKDTAYEVQLTAIASLQGRKCPEVYDFLTQKLRNPGLDLSTASPENRRTLKGAVLTSLCSLGYTRAIPVLVDIFLTEPALRQATGDALVALKNKRVSSVLLDGVGQLRTGDDSLRLHATELISHCGLPATKSELYDELLLIQYKARIASGEPPELVRNELIKSASPWVVSTLAHLLQQHAATPEGQPVAERILSHIHAMPPSRTMNSCVDFLSYPQPYIQEPTIQYLIHSCYADASLLPKLVARAILQPEQKPHQPSHLPRIIQSAIADANFAVVAKAICSSYVKNKRNHRPRYPAYFSILFRKAGNLHRVFPSFLINGYLPSNSAQRRDLEQILFSLWRDTPDLPVINYLMDKHLSYRIPRRKAAVKQILLALLQFGASDDRMIREFLTYAHNRPTSWELVHNMLATLPPPRRHAQMLAFLQTTFDMNILRQLVALQAAGTRELVHGLLDDPSIQLKSKERVELVSFLEVVGDATSIEPLSRELQRRGCPKARVEAARVLGSLAEEAAVPALQAVLTDPDGAVVKQSVIGLGQIPHSSAIDDLKDRRDKDQDPAIAAEASKSLASIYNRYSKDLSLKALDDATQDSIRLIGILESLGDDRALSLLLPRLAASHDPHLTIAVVRALRAIHRPAESIPALEERLRVERHDEARLEIENAIDYLLGSETFEVFRLASQVCTRPLDRDALLEGHKLEQLISEPLQIASLRDALAAAYRKKDEPDSFVAHLDTASDVLVAEVIRASGTDPEGKIKPHANRIGYVAQIDNAISSTARDIHDLRLESRLHHPAQERTGKPTRQLTPEDADAARRAFTTLFIRTIQRIREYRTKPGASQPTKT